MAANTAVTPRPVQTLPNGVIVGQSAHADISPPLITLRPATNSAAEADERERVDEPEGEDERERVGESEEEEEREREEREREEQARRAQRPVHDAVVQSAPISIAAMPAPANSFDGATQATVLDPNGAVGPNHYVQMINVRTQIFNKYTGASLYGPIDNNWLFYGFGGPCARAAGVDPIVLHDQLADRWLLSYLVGSEDGGGMCIAISQSPDPTGVYYRYYFPMTGGFYDYPKFGVWPDGYYMTAHYNGLQTIVAFERAKMLVGDATASYQQFDKPGTNTLTPADLDGSTLPAAGTPNFVAELPLNTNNIVKIWKVAVNWTTPTSSNANNSTSLTVAAYTPGNIVPHAGGAALWALSDPLMFRLAYRKFSTYDVLVASHHVNANGVSGLRWYELRNPGGTATVYQQGTYAPDAKSRWIPSITMDRAGDIALGYNFVTSTTEPGIAYAGRLASDPLGQMSQGETILVSGSGTYAEDRWGDYSAMSIDPNDDCTFWFTAQYNHTSGVRTRIASFKFPTCTAPSPTPTPIPNTVTNVALNKTVTGSTACAAGQGAAQAVDGSLSTKWCSLDATKVLQVDLGASYNIREFVVKHASAGGESSFYNTKDFNIQISPNGSTWSTPVSVTNNTSGTTRHIITTTAARYVKLNVTAPESSGTGAARIYELEVYGAPAGVTPTPTPSPTPAPSGLKVQYQVADPSAPSDNQIVPNFKIVNAGGTSVPLSELTIRYWYTRDTAIAQTASCDFFPPGCANVSTSFVVLSPTRTGADVYYQIGFTSGAGSIAPGGNSGEIKTRVHKTDWSAYTEAGDYSYDGTKTAYADWSKVTLYRNGVLVWGTEP
jgi:hypothetical protein